jgi:hypothetical protein
MQTSTVLTSLQHAFCCINMCKEINEIKPFLLQEAQKTEPGT